MRKTKFVALLLVVAIVASMVVPSVSAAGDYTLSIVDKATGAATINANAGDTVDVYVTISNNPGVSCVAFNVSVPEGWSVKAAQNQKLFMGDAFDQASSDNYTAGPNKDYFLWLMANGTQGDDFDGIAGGKLLTQNGNLVLVRYQIPEDAQSGAYTISVLPDLTNCFHTNVDSNGYIVPSNGKTNQVPATESLTINVKGTEPEVPAGAACPEHTDVNTWTEVAEGTWTEGAIADGHYKLTGNQTLTKALTVAGNVCIDLNGFNITAPNKNNVRAIEIAEGANLVICDSAEVDGVISGGKVYNSAGEPVSQLYGANIFNEGTFTLYGGTISGGYTYTAGTYYCHASGGNIYGAPNSVTNIKGGTITEGKVYKSSSYTSTVGIGGGNIFSEGTLNISGGIISDGVVEKIGAVSHTNVRNNYIYGGNIRMRGGELNISGGTITGGSLTGISKNSKGPMTAYHRGGNIYTAETVVTISGGIIADGLIEMEASGAKTTASKNVNNYIQGGNICVYGGSISITGGTITGGALKGKVTESVADSGASLNLETYGGNLAILGGATATMTGGTITKGVASRAEGETDNDIYGGNVCVSGAGSTFTMTGGELSEGYARYRGGNLSVNSDGVATIGGNAVIKDGKTESQATGSRGTEAVIVGAGSKLYIQDNAQLTNVATAENPALSTVYAITNGKMYVSGGKVEGAICAAATASNPNSALIITGGEFDIIEKSSQVPAANFSVGVGTTYKECESLKFVEGEAVVLAAATGKYTNYATLAEALAAAVAGDKVNMLTDVTAAVVSLKTGVTLELNGKILTADEFTSAFGQTLDSVGGGKIVAESVSFATDNKQLPVTIGNETTFENLEFATKSETVDNKHTYKFYVKSEAAATLIDDAILAGAEIAVEVKVSWTNAENETKEKTFYLDEADLAKLAQNWDTKMVVLTINDVSGITDLTCTAQIRSGTVAVTA